MNTHIVIAVFQIAGFCVKAMHVVYVSFLSHVISLISHVISLIIFIFGIHT
jgi:hypothetical protein